MHEGNQNTGRRLGTQALGELQRQRIAAMQTLIAIAILAAVASALGCGPTSEEGRPPGRERAAPTAPEPPPTKLEQLRLAGAVLDAPSDWPSVSPASVERLVKGVSGDDDDRATVRVVGRRLPNDAEPALWLMSYRLPVASRQPSPAQVMEDAIRGYRIAADARGATVTADGDCVATHCEMRVRFVGAFEMRTRVRIWWAGEALAHLGCSCVAEGCAHFGSCSLPEPAATAPAHRGGDGEQGMAGELHACPMHPEVQREHAGLCPICGMNLEPLD
jgi:hypothetical protein